MRTAQALSGSGALASRHRGRQGPTWSARLQAQLHARSLDQRLARGAAPWESPQLAARALKITDRRRTQRLASSYEALLERAQTPRRPGISSVVPPCHLQVRHAMPLILKVTSRLRSTAPLNPRGIAQLRELIRDGAGPCYSSSSEEALSIALEQALHRLEVSV